MQCSVMLELEGDSDDADEFRIDVRAVPTSPDALACPTTFGP